jgi:Glycerol-3-phosphate dehydrogenase
LGLKLYDWLAGVKPEDQRRMLTRNQTLRQEPLLKSNDVKGGAIYAEYRTDDARLTIEIMKTAKSRGACVLNYCKANNFLYKDGRIIGAEATDHSSIESPFEIHAAVVVNAAGPWVDELREKDKSKIGKSLHLTKGVHIVVPHSKLPVHQAIYFDVEDGRMIFAIPRGNITYIGTTDTSYHGSIDEVYATKEDVDYLLGAVNQTFKEINLTATDVESSWAGLRPLIHEDGKSASELSRKDEIFESDSGLISIAGGKLTGYRKMAERVVDKVVEDHFADHKIKPCQTERLAFTGSDFKNYNAVRKYIGSIGFELRKYSLEREAPYLVSTYGKQCGVILNYLSESFQLPAIEALTKAELRFSLQHEMVVAPEDFFVRRTGFLYFNQSRMKEVLLPVLLVFQQSFDWSQERLKGEIAHLQRLMQQTHQF